MIKQKANNLYSVGRIKKSVLSPNEFKHVYSSIGYSYLQYHFGSKLLYKNK